ncbi:MAG: NUDIX hydrolase [Dehalococcoidia bacterium]
MLDIFKYCYQCGKSLSLKNIDNNYIPYCEKCEKLFYSDPKLVVVVLVEHNNKLVLIKRSFEPAMGRWCFPSGYVNKGEKVEKAAIREVKEETGLDIIIKEFIGLYSSDDNPVIIAAFSAKSIGGKLYSGFETDAVDLIEIDSLSDFPFEFDKNIYNDYLSIKKIN